MHKVQIYDTTLRDGSQGEGVSFSVEDKIKITQRLDNLGIDYIEGGWPGSNPKDRDYFQRIKNITLKNAKVSAFGSTRRAGIKVEQDLNIQALLAVSVKTVAIVGKCWDFHVHNAINTTLEENIKMIADTVAYLKQKGREVFFDAEHFFDGFKHNPQYALATIRAAAESGADAIVLCDTNGGMLPLELQAIIQQVRREIDTPLGIHAHNDAGMAVANSITAVQNGIQQVQGTINGYGERCGNANLCTVIPNLQLKLNVPLITQAQLQGLTELSRYVAEMANVIPDERQPYVGSNAFAHKGGIHVDAVNKNPETYEHVQPEVVGNRRRILLSELSGKSNILYRSNENNLGLEKGSENIKLILNKLKEMEYDGYQFEGAEASFDLLVWKSTNRYKPLFELEGFRAIIEKHDDDGMHCEATIKVRVGDKRVHTAADGNGPVNALDAALRKALEQFYPQLKKVKLVDFKVRVLDGKDGTGAKVRVLIETKSEKKTWGTVGVSPNIIEASWMALVDSFEYGILCEENSKALKEEYKELKHKV
ncbi:MAG: citramalate synthase [Dethiobacteria bacterium]|jgi:2-isopropylmalate synthase